MDVSFATFNDVLAHYNRLQPNKLLFEIYDTPQKPKLTYGELYQKAQHIAKHLLTITNEGDRVILLMPSCLEFLITFFACHLAKRIPTPCNPPVGRNHAGRLKTILHDAEPSIIIALEKTLDKAHAVMAEYAKHACQVISIETLLQKPCYEHVLPTVDENFPALLQYSSGTHSAGRGVVITHKALLANERTIQHAFQNTEHDVIVTWLPFYHDMGLIGNILQPTFIGGTSIIMQPSTFIKRPYLWLQAISEHKATVSGGPNFSFAHCVQRITSEQLKNINLSSLRILFCGAEPIRKQVMLRFAEHFAPYQFNAKALYPCYGLAEATLIVSGGPPLSGVSALQTANSNVVDCGIVAHNCDVIIVDPNTLSPRNSMQIGEIWVKGDSIASAYWHKPELSRTTFQAFTSTGEGPYCRTGDLGFLDAKHHLYVNGRIKECLIVRGQNYHPHDLEFIIDELNPVFARGNTFVFADAKEQVIVLQEVSAKRIEPAQYSELCAMIREGIFNEFGIQPNTIALLPTTSLPLTSSGKKQRRLALSLWQQGLLPILHKWTYHHAHPEPSY